MCKGRVNNSHTFGSIQFVIIPQRSLVDKIRKNGIHSYSDNGEIFELIHIRLSFHIDILMYKHISFLTITQTLT